MFHLLLQTHTNFINHLCAIWNHKIFMNKLLNGRYNLTYLVLTFQTTPRCSRHPINVYISLISSSINNHSNNFHITYQGSQQTQSQPFRFSSLLPQLKSIITQTWYFQSIRAIRTVIQLIFAQVIIHHLFPRTHFQGYFNIMFKSQFPLKSFLYKCIYTQQMRFGQSPQSDLEFLKVQCILELIHESSRWNLP